MYHVVLIDDEPLIVEGLRRVIPWSDYNCEVVGTADDAVSGADVIRSLHPHILFTDIRMPGDDGLIMLAGLRSEFPDMQVTVLTGYREFSYAQEAIRLGVTRFLLKPSKMNEIREALTVMTQRLDRIYSDNAGNQKNRPDKNGSGLFLPSENRQDKGETFQNEAEEAEPENAGRFLVKQALAYMEKHKAEKLALQDVADACYVSQWHLSKLLNRYNGKSFYDILNTLRIKSAKELLKDPGLRIGDIGEMVGYSDTAHFAKVFKKLVGMSANEYRNSL